MSDKEEKEENKDKKNKGKGNLGCCWQKSETESDNEDDESESDEDSNKYSELDDSAKKVLVYTKAVNDNMRKNTSPKNYSSGKSDPVEAQKKHVHKLMGLIPEGTHGGGNEAKQHLAEKVMQDTPQGSYGKFGSDKTEEDKSHEDDSEQDGKSDLKEYKEQLIKPNVDTKAENDPKPPGKKFVDKIQGKDNKPAEEAQGPKSKQEGTPIRPESETIQYNEKEKQLNNEVTRKTANAEEQKKAQHDGKNFLVEENEKKTVGENTESGNSVNKEDNSKEDGGTALKQDEMRTNTKDEPTQKEDGGRFEDKQMDKNDTAGQSGTVEKTNLGGKSIPFGREQEFADERRKSVAKSTLESDMAAFDSTQDSKPDGEIKDSDERKKFGEENAPNTNDTTQSIKEKNPTNEKKKKALDRAQAEDNEHKEDSSSSSNKKSSE